jgi:hypothetical protein
MATVSREIARSLDNTVVIEVSYDTDGFDVRGFTITNNGGGTVTATVTKDGVQGSWSLSAGPGQTVSDNVPANLVAFDDDGTGNPAIPFSTLSVPIWYGEFGIWNWVVTS